MSQSTAKETRRHIRRAFGEDGLRHVEALEDKIRALEVRMALAHHSLHLLTAQVAANTEHTHRLSTKMADSK